MNERILKSLKQLFIVISLVIITLMIIGIIKYEVLQQYILDLIGQLKQKK